MLLLAICIVLLMIENALYTNIGHHSFLAGSVFMAIEKGPQASRSRPYSRKRMGRPMQDAPSLAVLCDDYGVSTTAKETFDPPGDVMLL